MPQDRRDAFQGQGIYRIAKILSDEKVEKPSYYQAVRGKGCYTNQCDFEHPYAWIGVSIMRMLEKPEYMGDTVNFRSHILIFRDTHEPIIDRRTWYLVQELRKTPAYFNCGTYNSSRKQNDKKCSSHCIQEDAVKQLLLETIRYACDSVRMDEEAFMEAMRSASAIHDMSEAKN